MWAALVGIGVVAVGLVLVARAPTKMAGSVATPSAGGGSTPPHPTPTTLYWALVWPGQTKARAAEPHVVLPINFSAFHPMTTQGVIASNGEIYDSTQYGMSDSDLNEIAHDVLQEWGHFPSNPSPPSLIGAYNTLTGEIYAAWNIDPQTLNVAPISLALAVEGVS